MGSKLFLKSHQMSQLGYTLLVTSKSSKSLAKLPKRHAVLVLAGTNMLKPVFLNLIALVLN